jgi:hypothetical protein
VDTEFESRLSSADVPHRFVMSGIWEIPFGKASSATIGTKSSMQ